MAVTAAAVDVDVDVGGVHSETQPPSIKAVNMDMCLVNYLYSLLILNVVYI